MSEGILNLFQQKAREVISKLDQKHRESWYVNRFDEKKEKKGQAKNFFMKIGEPYEKIR